MLESAGGLSGGQRGWAVFAYVWDGTRLVEVGSTSGRDVAPTSVGGWGGTYDPFISASDDLSTFTRLVQNDGFPFMHTWDGRGNPSAGTQILFGLGFTITMSGDGNTVFTDSHVAKRSWPTSR
jgi:hypothetical protein